ncbi:Phosphoheptose isomerase [Prochlorococcus sp. MIT 1306]|nr:Phosphoheptose isomerase [Prochlorococcus sp. MIT 1306]
MGNKLNFEIFCKAYIEKLTSMFNDDYFGSIKMLADSLEQTWLTKKTVFICGNGGSAANAMHIANDMHFGIGSCDQNTSYPGLRIEALPTNIGVITCLANDLGYENIYSQQLQVKGEKGDLLIVLSGSGNSPNIVKAIRIAKKLEIKTIAITGFDGGLSKKLADISVHFEINDMQIAEDIQVIVGHICMQWLGEKMRIKRLEEESCKNG